ncbi:MAG: hypothetical protein R2865_09000 [Deinococcales bacterium]
MMVVGARVRNSKIGDGGRLVLPMAHNMALRYDLVSKHNQVMSGFFGSVVAISQNDGFIAEWDGEGLYMFELVGSGSSRQLIPIQTSKFRFDQNRLTHQRVPPLIYERQNTGTCSLSLAI